MINREDTKLLSQIKKKLMKDDPRCPEHYAEYQAKEILEIIPEELEINLYEWLNNKPLSDIYIKELSINLLLKAWGERCKTGFAEAVKEIVEYIEWGYLTKTHALCKYDIY